MAQAEKPTFKSWWDTIPEFNEYSDDWVTIKEAAVILEVSVAAVYRCYGTAEESLSKTRDLLRGSKERIFEKVNGRYFYFAGERDLS